MKKMMMPESMEPNEPMMGTKESMPKPMPKIAGLKKKKKKITSIDDLKAAAKSFGPKKMGY